MKTNSWEDAGKDAYIACKHKIRIFPAVKINNKKNPPQAFNIL